VNFQKLQHIFCLLSRPLTIDKQRKITRNTKQKRKKNCILAFILLIRTENKTDYVIPYLTSGDLDYADDISATKKARTNQQQSKIGLILVTNWISVYLQSKLV
jgi:hypothetical protein